jgi:hypothetical protein
MKRCTLVLLAAILAAAQSASEVEITAEPHHHLILTNDQIRVFYVDVPPHGETLKHWHRHDYIYVTLGDCSLINSVVGKPPVTLQLTDGLTQLSPGPFLHAVHDISDAPFRNVTIEILQDTRLHTTRSPWTEDRGLDILHGGTAEILWVKDAIRATEFELQPGAGYPSQNHAHPLLLIPVNDLDLYLNDPRVHDMHEPMVPATHFKLGTATWLPLGFKRPITNAGHSPARFVTLEFP